MNKHIYFASDFHLGVPDHKESLERERLFVQWLDEIKHDAGELFLMGDIFDFWFEYKTVVPKGFVRLLGKLAELSDKGIPIHLFRGNHDIWAFDYLNKEINITLHRYPEIYNFNGKKFYLAHGDGLGPGDNGYKLLKKVFECKINQWLFKWLHPDLGSRLGLYFSRKSRYAHIAREGQKEKITSYKDEMLYKYSLEVLKTNADIDYFIFGHRHMPIQEKINDKTTFMMLGDWLTNFTYAVFDGKKLELKYYKTS